MKKKFVFFILFAILCLSTLSVHAEESLPSTLSFGDYKFVVEGFALKVYPMTKTGNSSGSDEELKNYVRNVGEEITIPANNVTFTYNLNSKTINDKNVNLIELRTNIDDDMIKDLLNEQLNSITSEKSYIVDLVVKYKVTSVPNNFTNLYVDHFGKGFLWGFINMDDSDNESTGNILVQTRLNVTNTQTINMIFLKKDNENNTLFEFADTEEQADSGNLFPFYYNYLLLSEGEPNNGTTYNKWIFTNLDSTNKLIDTIQELNDNYEISEIVELGNLVDDSKTTVALNIPNTALDSSKLLIIFGVALLILGTTIIGKLYLNHEN